MRKKLDEKTISTILLKYQEGESPDNLASLYEVHPTTIRRYLRDSGEVLSTYAQPTKLPSEDLIVLKNILFKHGVADISTAISDLEDNFTIIRNIATEDEDFKILEV